jgi:hypothetical protein
MARPQFIFHDHAPKLAALDLPLLPLINKLPAIKGGRGFLDATSNAAIIARWCEEYPHANIGIACHGKFRLIIIDVDPRHGGHVTMQKLSDAGCSFPICPEAVTGNRGRHLYFALPENVVLHLFKLGPGIDVKWNGYVVAPPSETGPSDAGPGGPYRYLDGRDPWSVSIPELPAWAIARLQKPKSIVPPAMPQHCSLGVALRRLDGLARFVAGAANGSRNAALNWASFKAAELIRDNQIGASEVVGTLRTAAIHAGLDAREIAATIESGLRAGIEKGAISG